MPPKRKPTTPTPDEDESTKKTKVTDNEPDDNSKNNNSTTKDTDSSTNKNTDNSTNKNTDKTTDKSTTNTDTSNNSKKKNKPSKNILKLPSDTSLIIGSDDEELSSGSESDGSKKKPWCVYGVNCYRKNPDHLKNFRHPTKKGGDNNKKDNKPKPKKKDAKNKDAIKTTTSNSDSDEDIKASSKNTTGSSSPSSSSSSSTPADKMKEIKKDAADHSSPDLENYKNVLRCALSKNKVSVDEKRMLRTFRRNHNIDDQDHFRLLMQFGWSADEYEDGQKKDDDCDLDEERDILENNGFAIISIKKGKNLTKAEDNVFSRVCAKFFQTMSQAQANYSIVEVGVIVNADLRKKYNLKLAEFTQAGFADVEWAFHGTTRDSIKVIAQSGFLHPDDLKKSEKQAWWWR